MTGNIFNYRDDLLKHFSELEEVEWKIAGDILLNAHKSNRCVWIAGNGGNAANALHFATDWNKGLYKNTGKPLVSRTLWENSALTSAFSNDQEFKFIFSDQLKMWAAPCDIALLMSAGGSSPNIIYAAQIAREMGLTVIGMTGGLGLQFRSLFDCHIHIPTDNIQIVEDIHASFGHTVFKYICANY